MAKDSEPTVRVYVTNAHQTSGGQGPGVVEIPAAEAAAIVSMRHGRVLADGEHPDDLGRSPKHIRGVTN
jgi:hypothetical protein